MEPHPSSSEIVRFDVFELDVRSGELRRHGLKIRLPHQSFHILRLLLARPGQVVTRDELRRALWTADTFVDFDVGLNNAIRKLREALDDSAERPRYVETLPRRGYRFVAPVESTAVSRVEQEPEASAPSAPAPVPPFPSPSPSPRWSAAWIVAGVLLIAAVAAMIVVSARRAAPIRSLAVLPFENLTGNAAQDYFVEGITDGLTTQLAQVRGLDVISRTSARQYKQPNRSLPTIGNELKVDAVVEGAVVRTGDRVRISAQLVHAASDRHVWARSYDGEMPHVLALQQRIASDIAAAVGLRVLEPSTGARARQAIDSQAYDLYLKGTTAMGAHRYDGFRTAVGYFEQAVARQPDFAEAHAALARAQLQFLFGGPLSPREAIPKAEAAARKALELDETLAQAHRTLGQILSLFHWRWQEADEEFSRAAQLSPDIDGMLSGVSLVRNGRFLEAVAEAEWARRRDPLSFAAQVNVGTAYRAAGQSDRAIAELRRALEIAPGHTRALFQLGITYVLMGRFDDAVRELEAALSASQGRNPRLDAYRGYAYARAGRPLDARRVLTDLEARRREQYVSSFGIALIHDVLGEKAEALRAIERAYEERAVEFAQMSQYPAFTTIAEEPRFDAVLRRIGLRR